MENKNKIYIFTDGSSLGNPGPGGWGAIIVSGEQVREIGGSEKHTTNNRMELSAAIAALRNVSERAQIILHTDSNYCINGITKWVHGWKRNNWKTSQKEEAQNRDLWEELLTQTNGKKIEWKYVAGHVGIAGNERADEIATSFAAGTPVKLYEGNFSGYAHQNILDTSHDTSQKKARTKNKEHSRAKAFSYLSLVGSKVIRHATWAECESRVKGKKAKFKKALSKEDEAKILKEWGMQ
ncbi:MAG: ribonuclease HI [Parcubacteria group bacterium]|nr:ribonuclease HI [Parcubacteria group bacterium]